MPSERNTQPRLVTEPTMKPTLAAPRHSSTPTCTRCIGCCALAGAKDASSTAAAALARIGKRRMKKSPANVMRARNQTLIKRTTVVARTVMPQRPQNERGPRLRASIFTLRRWSAMTPVMAMTDVMPAAPERHRRQFEIGNPRRDVEPGLALYADRLQRVGILRTADQKIAPATDADRRVGADAAVIAGKIAASNPVGRRVHRPGQAGQLGDAEIQAEAMNRRDVRFGTAAVALEHAFEAGDRADHEADMLAALALQNAGANRQRAGAAEGRHQCRDGQARKG